MSSVLCYVVGIVCSVVAASLCCVVVLRCYACIIIDVQGSIIVVVDLVMHVILTIPFFLL